MGDSKNEDMGWLARNITFSIIFKVILDSFLALVDVGLDFYHAVSFTRSRHSLWATACFLVILLPGLTCAAGEILFSRHEWNWRRVARIFLIAFLHPFWTIYIGKVALFTTGNANEMVHFKNFEGLMEAPYFFLIQIVILQAMPDIGYTA